MNVWKKENHVAIRTILWYNFPKQGVRNLKQKEKENISNGKCSF